MEVKTLDTLTDVAWALSDHVAGRSLTVAKGQGVLANGTVLGMTTADSKFREVCRTKLSANKAAGQTVISVDDASVITVGDTVKIMQRADATKSDEFAVTDTDLVNDTITLAYVTTNAYTTGDFVRVVDGSETAVCILNSQVDTGTSSDDEDYTDKDRAGTIHAISVRESLLTGCDARVKLDLTMVDFI